jgi:(4S)-4-hydroxy-5-phosphonooxypentane-2,3-dione isomerase
MIAFQIYITLKPDRAQEFMEVALNDARRSVEELGNLRFDVYQHQDDPLRLVVMEVYDSPEAFEEHRRQPYVEAWRNAVKEMTLEYNKVNLTLVFPAPEAWGKA